MSDLKIAKTKLKEITAKLLWSPSPLENLLELMNNELAWLSCIPDTDDEAVQKHIWTAYGMTKSYMANSVFEVSNSYIRDRVLKIATQLARDEEEGSPERVLSGRSRSSDSVQVSFESLDKGSLVMSLLKEFDKFKKIVVHHETGRY
jgi:hypothetical protein